MPLLQRFGIFILLVLVGGLGSSCHRASSALPFQVAVNPWIGYEPLFLARSLDRLDPKRVRLLEMSAAQDSLRALRAGMVDAAALTLDEVFTVLQDGVELRIVLVMDFSQGADALLAHPDVQDLADLKGRRIGVESTAVGAYLLSRALDAGGLQPRDISPRNLPYGEHETAYRTRAVDAVVTFEPARTRLLDAGARLLFDSRQIPDEIFDVLVVREESLRRDPEAVSRIREAWFAAQAHLKANPLDASRRMAPRLALPPETLLRALKGLAFPSEAEDRTLLTSRLLPPARQLAERMHAKQLLTRPVDPSRLLGPPLPESP